MITIYVSQEEGVVRVSCKGKFRDILLELTVAVTVAPPTGSVD